MEVEEEAKEDLKERGECVLRCIYSLKFMKTNAPNRYSISLQNFTCGL